MTEFIGSLYTYPWDLADEGMDVAMERFATTGCEEVMLTPCYHQSTYFLPHNPKRPVYCGEDGAVYFSPDFLRYDNTRMKPHVSKEVTDPEWFDRIVEGIGRHGLRLGTWVVYTFQANLTLQYPEFANHDAFGTPHRMRLSLGPKDVQEYMLALTSEILDRFKPSILLIESLERRGMAVPPKRRAEMTARCQTLLTVCFNPGSVQIANDAGMDGEAFRNEVVDWLRPRLARRATAEDELPADDDWMVSAFEGRLKQYLDAQRRSATDLWIRVADLIHESGAKLHTPLATESSALRDDLDPAINAHIDRALAGAVASADEIDAMKAQIAPGGGVMASINRSGQSDAGPLTEDVATAAKAGAMGAIFYNYGLLREEELGFIGEALGHVRSGN